MLAVARWYSWSCSRERTRRTAGLSPSERCTTVISSLKFG
jgi:hypothetical protein